VSRRKTPAAQLKRWRDPEWRYTPSVSSDIRKTFARLKRQAKEAATPAPASPAVLTLRSSRKAAR
jgi:hypothetical protein